MEANYNGNGTDSGSGTGACSRGNGKVSAGLFGTFLKYSVTNSHKPYSSVCKPHA